MYLDLVITLQSVVNDFSLLCPIVAFHSSSTSRVLYSSYNVNFIQNFEKNQQSGGGVLEVSNE